MCADVVVPGVAVGPRRAGQEVAAVIYDGLGGLEVERVPRLAIREPLGHLPVPQTLRQELLVVLEEIRNNRKTS